MSLLNPFALWGLLFLAVPLLLLLLLNRKVLVLPWAAYAWMQEAVVRQRKEYELTDLLKLIAKCLLLLALTLFTARPFLTTQGQSGNLLIIVDNSPSMNALLDQGSRLELARQIAAETIDHHDGGIALYTFGASLEPVIGKFSQDKGALKDRLSRIQGSPGYGNAERLLTQIRALPIFPDTARVLVLGDFQKSWLGSGTTLPGLLQTYGSGFPMIWAQIDARPRPGNVAVTALSISPDGAFPGRPAFLEVELQNGAAVATSNRVLTLWIDDQVIQRQIIRLEGNEKRRLPFTTLFKAPGWHTLRAELDNDTLRTDNIRYAAINIPPSLNVLSIVPATSPGGPAPDLFVKAALRGILPSSWLTYRSISTLELDSLPLDGVHILMSFGLPFEKGSPLSRQLLAFTERGGGTVAFLPALQHNEAGASPWTSVLAPTNTCTLEPRALQNTWGEFLKEPGLKADSIRFKQTAILTNARTEEIRLTSTAGPLAALRTLGRGRLAVAGFVPVPRQTSLPFNPNFVQLVLRMIWDVRGWTALRSDNGQVSDWQLSDLRPDRTYTLTSGMDINRTIPVEGVGKEARLLLPPDLPQGIYTLREDGLARTLFGHNRDTGDSQLDPVTPGDLEASAKQGLIYTAATNIDKIQSRRDLGWLMFLLLVAALALEAYAHFFRKRR